MKKILVTTDLSANSKAGIRFAMQLQKQTNCELVFYHVVEIIKPTSWNDKRFEHLAAERINENITRVSGLVKDVFSKSSSLPGNNTYTAEVGVNTDEMIVAYAKKIKADFICLSTHGSGKIQKIMGTHASDLISNSTVPLLVVPKDYRSKPLSEVFYASDFSELGKELKILEQFTSPLKLKTNVVHYDYLLHVPENKKKLETKAAKYGSSNLKFVFKNRDIELSLAQQLKKDIVKEKPSLVVLFTKQNRNWFDRFFHSGEAEKMSFNLQVPLLVYHKK